MLDHFGIQVDDFATSRAFYEDVLEPLGYGVVMDVGPAVGYGPANHPTFWISAATDPIPNRQSHIAFAAADAAAVRAFHARAVARGFESLHAPRLWPEYHSHYYSAFVRDPDGNNVEAVCHTVAADDLGEAPAAGEPTASEPAAAPGEA